MNVLGLGFVLLSAAFAQANECKFTRDCRALDRCMVMDAGCRCTFGSCVLDGTPFFQDKGKECSHYKDCACSANPANCFCREGSCISDPAKKWECHVDSDCKAMEKCKDKECACSDNLCEFDCNTTADCLANSYFHCLTTEGYTCQCTKHLCDIVKLPAECATLHDCVKIGKCTNNKLCAWFVKEWRNKFVKAAWRKKFPKKNCRDNSDCAFSKPQCAEGTCSCQNRVKVSKREKWGECVLN